MAKEQSDEDIRAEDRASQVADLGTDEIETRSKAEPQGQEGAPQEKPEAKEPVKVGGKYEDKRKAIADKAKALRAGNNPELESEVAKARKRMVGHNVGSPQIIEDAVDDAVDDTVEQVEDKPVVKPATKHKLKVHGREVELDDAQLLAAAQKAVASDDILDEAKRARSEARELLESVRAARADQPTQAQPQKPQPAQATPADDVDMDEVIERIQVGTPEAGIAALEKFGDRIERRLLAKIGNLEEVIANQVDQVTETRIREKETRDIIASFGADNPEFAASKALQGALALETADTMRVFMRDIGVEDGVLARFMEKAMVENPQMNEAQAVGAAYRFLQTKGHELPSHGEVLNAAAVSIRKQMGMPEKTPAAVKPAPRETTQNTTSQHVQLRTERKQVMQTQPRRASVAQSLEAQEQSRDDARRKAVEQMRASRGRR